MITLQSVIIWLIVAFIVFVLAILLFRNGRIRLLSFIFLPVLALYLSFVAQLTLFSRIPNSYTQYKIMLFWSYSAIANGSTHLIYEVFWNVILFIPIGMLQMLIFSCKRKWMISVFVGFLLSSSIEVIQLLSHRGLFEFDDIVHNTLGAFIGTCLYVFISVLSKKKRSNI